MNRKLFCKNSITTNPFFPIRPFDGDGDGEPNPSVNLEDPSVQSAIAQAVQEATAGLKTNNMALKDEKTELKGRYNSLLDSFGGEEGIKALQSIQKNLQNDEYGKLISEGKHEEALDLKTKSLKSNYEQQITALQTKAEELAAGKAQSDSSLQRVLLDRDVAAAANEVKCLQEPGVLLDISRAVRDNFTWDDNLGRLVIQQDGVIENGKDGKTPKTVAEWLAEQQATSRHWWPMSAGGGSKGSKGNLANGSANPWSKENWNLTEQGKFVREHGIDEAKKIASSVGSKLGATAPPA